MLSPALTIRARHTIDRNLLPVVENLGSNYLVVLSTADTVITLVIHIMMKDRRQGVLLTHAREQC
jgi:hypothetical protein